MSSITEFSRLKNFTQVAGDRFVACCPAHDDRSPSLSIKDTGEKILFHCFAGCSQNEVIDALVGLGIWLKPTEKSDFTLDELQYMTHYCLAWNGAVRRGRNIPNYETEVMESFLAALSIHSPSRYQQVVGDAGYE